ncbi:unnamed protein product [Schistocephalus solidus]|uniref:Ubiquinol-cytochrome C reductase hinge domain-containing protein n=1 Tax=Schistocephalus solidus TaxID=70667 RepID=A0A3P7EFG5_SCHSO|nr:unnamed protein product [Schistocephalus solidus]
MIYLHTFFEIDLDQGHGIRERCRKTDECMKFSKVFEDCCERQPKTKESCEEELIDLVNCVDKCVGPKLFNRLR